MAKVFISLGSNLGNRSENINRAVRCLKEDKDMAVQAVSSIIETEPVKASGPEYLNAVIKLETKNSPYELLNKLQDIENSLGRMRTYKNAPRIIDLDILLYDDLTIDEPSLKVPHPQLWERGFIMTLVLEIEPDIDKSKVRR